MIPSHNTKAVSKNNVCHKKILAKKIPLRIASIIMKANEDEAENIMELCKNLGVEVTPPMSFDQLVVVKMKPYCLVIIKNQPSNHHFSQMK